MSDDVTTAQGPTVRLYGARPVYVEPAPGLPDYLLRVVGEAVEYAGLRGLTCDYAGCFAAEWDDLIDGTSDQLRPMYLDTRHDVMMCQKCLDAGKHLDD